MPSKFTDEPEDIRRSSELLTPAAAAHLFGVTSELLFAYALNPPKKAAGDNTTLQHTNDEGRSGFRRADIERFDEFLQAPWSQPGAPRPAIPTFIVDYLKVECGGQCARCGKGYKLENAHIQPYAESRSHHHHNLIRLCTECHEEFETKRLIPYAEIRALKDQLINRIRERLLRNENLVPAGVWRIPTPALQFVGRDHELGALVEALRQKRSICICGAGGIGKTQLLINALHAMPDLRPVFWMNVEAYRTVSELQFALAKAIAKPGQLVSEDQIADVLAKADVAVVFDGVEKLYGGSNDDVEDFFQTLLTSTSAPQFIFTSQVALLGVDLDERMEVGPINKAAAGFVLKEALALKLRAIDREAEALISLANFCEGHPLTIQIAVGLIRFFQSAHIVLERIVDIGVSAVQNPTRLRQTTATSLQKCLLVSYGTLTAENRNLLWLVAQCPTGCFAEMFESANNFGIRDVSKAAADLRSWHLLKVDIGLARVTRLYVLSPIRAFVDSEWRSQPPSNAEDLELQLIATLTLQARVINDRYVQGADVVVGLTRFDLEFPNYMHALEVAAKRTSGRCLELAASLAGSLMNYCFITGSLDRGVKIMQIGTDAAQRAGTDSQAGEMLTRLIALAARAGTVDIVRNAAAELGRLAANSLDYVIIGDAASGRGTVAILENRLEDAREAFAQASIKYEQAAQHPKPKSTEPGEDAQIVPFEPHDWATHKLAMSLMQQGFVEWKTRRVAQALKFYERTLALVHAEKDDINLGSVLHQIGNCTAELELNQRAFDSYLAAARHFLSIQMEEYLSNSLGEIGYVLVNWDPDRTFDELLTEAMILNGLADIANQVARVFDPSTAEIVIKDGAETLRKLFGLVALASFSSKNHFLFEWAQDLRDVIMRPFSNQMDQNKRNQTEKILLMHLDLTLTLAGSLSEVKQTKGIGPIPSLIEIEHFARLCYLYFDPGWEIFHPFEWLETYLRRHRGASFGAQTLQKAIILVEEQGRAFSLPN